MPLLYSPPFPAHLTTTLARRGAFVIDLLAVIPYEVCYTMFDTGEATRQATNGALQPASIVRTALPLLRIVRAPSPHPHPYPAPFGSAATKPYPGGCAI